MMIIEDYILGGKLNAIVEQLENLMLIETRIRIGGRLGLEVNGSGLVADGGGTGCTCLGAFKLVVVGADEEMGCGFREHLFVTRRRIRAYGFRH